MMGCDHPYRNELAGQDMWICRICGNIGRDEEILYTAVQAREASRDELETEIERLRSIIDKYRGL